MFYFIDLNKSTKAEKKKKVTCREDKKRKHQTELLDDEEIESVINNTESFLDNVEEVLDSLDSDLDDSDEGATCSFQLSCNNMISVY